MTLAPVLSGAADPQAVLGRAEQLAALTRFLAEPDGPPLAVLSGAAGIGKTTLARSILTIARDQGWRAMTAAPAEAEASLSFAALGDLLADVDDSETAALAPPQRHTIEVALLRRAPAGEPPDTRAVAVAVAALLGRLAGSRRLLLAVDDVQWLDQPTAAVLAFLLRRRLAPGIRVLATVRDDWSPTGPLAPVVASTQPLRLPPLDLDHCGRLLQTRLARDLSHADVRRIHAAAEGNPLHLLEIGRLIADGGELVPGTLMFQSPQPLAALVRRRLRLLPASCRETLLVVAALSRPQVEVVRRLRGDELEADLDRAVEAGLVVVDGPLLRFAHPLFAAACYQDASADARRRVHRLLASCVDDPEQRARHLALAGDAPDAGVAGELERAAHHARRRGALDPAGELMLLSAQFTPADAKAADGSVQAARTRRAAQWLMEAGHSQRAVMLLKRLVASTGPGRELALNLLALAAVVYELEGPEPSRALDLKAMQHAKEDPVLLAEAQLAYADHSHFSAAERRDWVASALALLQHRPDADPAVVARALRELAIARYHLGEGMPRDLMDQAMAVEASLPEPLPLTWRARTCLGECLKYLDEFHESERLLAETAQLAEELDDVICLCSTLAHQSELALWLGDWPRAERCADRAAGLARQSDQNGRLAYAMVGQLLVAACRGNIPDARLLGQEALAAARAAGDSWSTALVQAALGFAELSADAPEAAVAALDQADAILDGQLLTAPRQWRYLEDHVEALVRVGRLDRAADRLQRLEEWAGSTSAGWPRVMAARARGLVLEAQGNRSAAIAALTEAVAGAEVLPLPFVRARAQLTLGTALRRHGTKKEARALLHEAGHCFDRLGAVHWAVLARREEARISGRTAARDGLTETETRVAELVCRGFTNKEVAAALFITARTVEAHLTRIYSKVGVRSRAELARQNVGVSAIPGDLPPA